MSLLLVWRSALTFGPLRCTRSRHHADPNRLDRPPSQPRVQQRSPPLRATRVPSMRPPSMGPTQTDNRLRFTVVRTLAPQPTSLVTRATQRTCPSFSAAPAVTAVCLVVGPEHLHRSSNHSKARLPQPLSPTSTAPSSCLQPKNSLNMAAGTKNNEGGADESVAEISALNAPEAERASQMVMVGCSAISGDRPLDSLTLLHAMWPGGTTTQKSERCSCRSMTDCASARNADRLHSALLFSFPLHASCLVGNGTTPT